MARSTSPPALFRPNPNSDDDWIDPFDPDTLDDDEPQPEPGDFWLDHDGFESDDTV